MFRTPRMRSLPDFVWTVAAAVVLAAGALTTRAVSDPSPWLHLKVGRFLLDGHRFGAVDPWAPYAHGSYEPTQWLPSVVTAVLYDREGLPAVAWTRTVGIVLLALALLLTVRRVARPAVALLASLVALAGAWPSLTERPQLAGFVLLVPVIGAWWATGVDHRPRWWLVPLTWLAACVHGIWSMGPVLGTIMVAGLVLSRSLTVAAAARLAGVLAACVAVTAVTPLGPRLTLAPFTVGSTARSFVAEWMASSARTPAVALTLLAGVAVFVLWTHAGQRPLLWKLLLWVASITLTLVMKRTVAVGAFTLALLLADALEGGLLLARRPPATGLPPGRREVAVLGAAALTATLLAIPLSAARAVSPRGVPTALVPALRALPAGTHILSDGDLSGWVMFTAPQTRPVFDIRVEVYSPAHIHGFIAAQRAQPGWAAYLQRTDTRAVVVRSDAPITGALSAQWHWRTVASSAGYTLLVAP